MISAMLFPTPAPHQLLISISAHSLCRSFVVTHCRHVQSFSLEIALFWIFACQSPSFTMYFNASGTLRSILISCLALSATIIPVLSAPAPAENTSPWIPRSLKALFEPRAASNQCGPTGTGLYITNKGSGPQTFTVFQGRYSINSDPYTSVTIAARSSSPVTLSVGFIGHVQRGTLLPATWVELNMVDGAADGDVSLEIGCDGAVQVQASPVAGNLNPPVFGFYDPTLFTKAPADAFFNPANPTHENLGGTLTKAHGVLDATGTIATGVINQATLNYEQSVLAQSAEYLWGGSGTGQAQASNNCLLITFY